MAPHSSALAWRIPGTGEPGELPCMGSHRVGHGSRLRFRGELLFLAFHPTFPPFIHSGGQATQSHGVR